MAASARDADGWPQPPPGGARVGAQGRRLGSRECRGLIRPTGRGHRVPRLHMRRDGATDGHPMARRTRRTTRRGSVEGLPISRGPRRPSSPRSACAKSQWGGSCGASCPAAAAGRRRLRPGPTQSASGSCSTRVRLLTVPNSGSIWHTMERAIACALLTSLGSSRLAGVPARAPPDRRAAGRGEACLGGLIAIRGAQCRVGARWRVGSGHATIPVMVGNALATPWPDAGALCVRRSGRAASAT